jgi:hypothetical protein
MARLTPIVHILFTFSETLGEGISLVSPHSVPSILATTLSILAILTSENDHYRHWYSSRGKSVLESLVVP